MPRLRLHLHLQMMTFLHHLILLENLLLLKGDVGDPGEKGVSSQNW